MRRMERELESQSETEELLATMVSRKDCEGSVLLQATFFPFPLTAIHESLHYDAVRTAGAVCKYASKLSGSSDECACTPKLPTSAVPHGRTPTNMQATSRRCEIGSASAKAAMHSSHTPYKL